jgi:pimeloyl-ACP methyl ester carboxylesterase
VNDTHTETALAELGGGFVSETAVVDGAAMHYVRGGHGPTLVLMHGFPQDWYGWRRIMPRLATRFTVLAVDLPGVGGSAPLADGYAAVDLARHVHHLVDGLGSGTAHLAGHDIGGCVAYAYARLFPERTRTVAVLEVPIPGIEPQLAPEVDVPLWHVPFHMTPGLPEALVTGRQSTYFRYFFDTFTADATAIGDADVEHYVDAYRRPEQLRSAFEFYRAMPANGSFNAEQTEPVDVPLLLVGGGHLFGPILPELAQSLRANYGWADVRVRVVDDAQHYLVEERPDEVAELLERHAGTG